MILSPYNDQAMNLLFFDTSLFLNTVMNLYDINKNATMDKKKIWFILRTSAFAKIYIEYHTVQFLISRFLASNYSPVIILPGQA